MGIDASSAVTELQLTSMAHGGSALGRDSSANERVTFVPFGIPGEKVAVRIVDEKPRYAYAEIVDIIEPSPDRIAPRCQHYGVCGGCHLQHVSYDRQLSLKREVVVDQLQRIAKIANPAVGNTIPSPSSWNYRNSVSFSITKSGQLGFHRFFRGGTTDDHDDPVVPIQECHIIDSRLLDLFRDFDLELPDLTRLTLRVGAYGDLLVLFEIDSVEPPSLEVDFPVNASILLPTGEVANLVGENKIQEHCAGRDWQVSASSFFQVNPQAAETLVSLVMDRAQFSGSENVLELYSGIGLFTEALSNRASHIVAVEASPNAVADAEVNLADTDNVELYQGDAEVAMTHLSEQEFDLVVLDPPRTGVSFNVIDAIVNIEPRRIVYVSCDPATLARDIRRLTPAGYALVSAQTLDMFPQTYHVETIALLEKR